MDASSPLISPHAERVYPQRFWLAFVLSLLVFEQGLLIQFDLSRTCPRICLAYRAHLEHVEYGYFSQLIVTCSRIRFSTRPDRPKLQGHVRLDGWHNSALRQLCSRSAIASFVVLLPIPGFAGCDRILHRNRSGFLVD